MFSLNSTWGKTKKSTIFLFFVVLCLLFLTGWLANYARVLIKTEAPAEYREGGMMLMTEYLLHGSNPFSFNNQPLLNNNYGVFYNFVVLPFAFIFSNTLLIHRVISIFFIFMTFVLITLVLIKRDNSILLAISGGELVIAGLFFYVTPLARPDSLGIFLFLCAIIVPWFRKFDTISLYINIFFSVLSFYTKTLFLLSSIIVTLYLFFFNSKRKGLIYLFFTTICLVFSSLVISRVFPLYFHNVIFVAFASYSKSLSHLWYQIHTYLSIYVPILICSILVLINKHQFFTSKSYRGLIKLLNFFDIKEPMIKMSIDYYFFVLLCNVIVIIFFFGQHTGNDLVYLFEFITPLLVLTIFRDLKKNHILEASANILIIFNIIIILFFVLSPNTPPPYEEEWQRLNQIISKSKNIFNSPVIVPELIKNGITPIDSGYTQYYYNTKPYPKTYLAPDYQLVINNGMKYYLSLKEKIKNKEFDHVIITRGRAPFYDVNYIKQYYQFVEEFKISMPQTGQSIILELLNPILVS